jgi:Na+-transporting methylmalonyl-CoA/oxaloacetate decarboxylase gamma subunit
MGFLQILFWFKKNILAIVLILFFLAMFYLVNRTIKVERENEEYKRIEQEVKNQNLNVKQNVQIIKKRTNNLNIDDRKQLLEKMFSE